MEFKLRRFTESDYKTILEWWKFWKFNHVPYDFLPQTGYVLSKDGVDVIVGFIYETNSKVCWIEFIVSNPKVKDRSIRKESKGRLLNILSILALEKGFRYIYANLKDDFLIKHYLDCGFIIGDKGYKEMIKTLY